MVRVGIVGVGKMGISHHAILGAHPRVEVKAVCDSATFLTSALRKHVRVRTFSSYRAMIDEAGLDAVFVATPTATHYEAAHYALEKDLHVFVEKPLCLDPSQSRRLAEVARARRRANQVGYHNRFIGTFREARRLVRSGALGEVHHVGGSAFGPVVTRPKTGLTWRSKRSEGGGCLHDYASHVIDLMNFVFGPPEAVLGASLDTVFSRDVEDVVHAIFRYPKGATGVLEANWSDESHRKMTTTLVVHGTHGKLVADRQECRVWLRGGAAVEGYGEGWTVKYITELQAPTAFYLRGEEYTAQIDAFVEAVESGSPDTESSFASAHDTDRVVRLVADAAGRR